MKPLFEARGFAASCLCMVALLFLVCCGESTTDSPYNTWAVKGGTPDGIQYSSASQITTGNVATLQQAWQYHAGDADTVNNRSQIQCNPIIVDGVLYATSAGLKAFAIDAATGKEIWKFQPEEKNPGLGVNRGVTYWAEGDNKRILYSYGEYLYALDANTGKKIETFGSGGRVSLKEGLGDRAASLMVLSNTPGVIYKDLIIMGTRARRAYSCSRLYTRL
jgi:quinoprotein glucose dehydrogenase